MGKVKKPEMQVIPWHSPGKHQAGIASNSIRADPPGRRGFRGMLPRVPSAAANSTRGYFRFLPDGRMGVAPTQKIRLSEESVAQVFRAAFSEYICLSDVSLWKRLMPDPIQQACIVLTSAATPEEASRLARTLVEERLAACASLIPSVESIYRWKGQVESAAETMLVIKTGPDQLAALEARLHELHSYETPEFLVLRVESGSHPYLDWLQGSLRQV
jgi:periplasmic divalent cation tolerance protein